jgi:restriction system protein
MPVPTYDQFIEPILRYLATHPNGAPAREVHDVIATQLGLSDSDKQELLPSGVQPIHKNRAGWAHDRLKRAGLSSSPRHGFWQLTKTGLEFAKSHPSSLSEDDVEKLATSYMDVRLRPANPASLSSSTTSHNAQKPAALSSPADRLGDVVSELRHSVRTEILDALASVSPTFFETIVLHLLHRIGYGASRGDIQRVGGVGDAGIDGVISLDKLGLEKVYVQAKRWQQPVGRPDIQAFYGALAGQRSKKGVFITTSAFTAQAVEFAKSVEGIVLVDGSRLADLMIDHEVGVSAKAVSIPKLDRDYFDADI